MPTRAEFETAADLFSNAAGLIDALVANIHSADAGQVLQGGSLGRQVPERIAAAATSASICQQQVIEAAQTCRERAAVIADYEWRLEMYEMAYYHFQNATQVYAANHAAWFLDETGTVPYPGDSPSPPRRPTLPPAWAEVRQP